MLARLLWLSVGTFVIGAEGFIVAGVLPQVASDLGTSLAACGQLITAYALAYAIGSPVLAALFGKAPRKPMLVAALAAFAVANAIAAVSVNLPMLIVGRVLLGLSAGLFIPTANAVAVQLVPPEMRGRAIATVIGGMTVAVALGAPIGTLIATQSTWRMPFAVVAAISAMASLALLIGMPGKLPIGSASLRERLALATRPAILAALAVTLFWSASTFVLFTYIAPVLNHFGIIGWQVSAAFFVFGVASAAGNVYGGTVVDRIGPARTLAAALVTLVAVFLAIAAAMNVASGPAAVVAILALTAVWGLAGWAFYPAQGARLVELAPEAPVVAFSLNSSALFFGQAGGALLGSATVAVASVDDLGLVSAACALLGLGVLVWSRRVAESATPVTEPAE